MSFKVDWNTPYERKVSAFILPNFAEQSPVLSTEPRPYVFVPLGDNSEEKAAITLAEAKDEAQRLVAQAKSAAERLLAEAKTQADQLQAEAQRQLTEAEKIKAQARDLGHQEGHQQGLREGQEAGLRAFEKSVAPFLSTFDKFERLYQDLWAINEPFLVELTMKTTERLLFHEVTTSMESISGAMKAALDLVQEQHQILFRLSDEDMESLALVRGEIQDHIRGLAKVTFEADPNLSRGDLVMETESGRVDATIRRRLEGVSSAIDEVLKESFNLDW